MILHAISPRSIVCIFCCFQSHIFTLKTVACEALREVKNDADGAPGAVWVLQQAS